MSHADIVPILLNSMYRQHTDSSSSDLLPHSPLPGSSQSRSEDTGVHNNPVKANLPRGPILWEWLERIHNSSSPTTSELYLFSLTRPNEARDGRVSKEATGEHPSVPARSHFREGSTSTGAVAHRAYCRDETTYTLEPGPPSPQFIQKQF